MVEHKGVLQSKSGASIVKHKPLFTHDSRFLITPCGNALKVFSTKTGECVNKLRSRHAKPIVAVQQNPKNQLQVISCSKDGRILFWDYQDGTIIKEIKLNISKSAWCITFLVLSAEPRWIILAKEACSAAYVLVAAQSKDGIKIQRPLAFEKVSCDPNSIAVEPQNKFVAAIYENELRLRCFVTKKDKIHKIKKPPTLCCVACHSSNYTVAAGDTLGRVFVWTDVFASNKPPRTVNHWHTLPVADLAFSVEGSYLYSGGGECVLVKWKIGSDSRSFVARLGLPIHYVVTSGDNQMIATSHLDNAIQLISSNNKLIQVCQGLAVRFQVVENNYIPLPIQTGLLFDPRSKSLVLNSRPGHLQFYSLEEDKLLFHLDVVGQNYISRERHRNIINTEVEKAAFDSTGSWLATVECRDDGKTSLQMSLKFWKFDDVNQKYELNTAVFLPHNDHVVDMKFRPSLSHENQDHGPLLVTAGLDKKYKIWVSVDETDAYGKKEGWTCQSLGYYRDMVPNCVSFSEDGSLLAVGFGSTVTLWEPDTTKLMNTLCHSKIKDTIRHCEFGRLSCRQYLVCCTEKNVTVWNLLNLTMFWNVSVPFQTLAVDNLSEHMAVFTNDFKLFVFKPSSPEIVYKFDKRIKPDVVDAIFIPHQSSKPPYDDNSCLAWQKHSQLYFLDANNELFTIGEEEDEKKDDTSLVPKMQEMQPLTPYGMIIAKQRKSDVKIAEAEQHAVQGIMGVKEVKELLNVPSHVLPPISMFCANFLSSVLVNHKLKRSKESKEEGSDGVTSDDEESRSISDDEMEVDSTSRKELEDLRKEKKAPKDSEAVTSEVMSEKQLVKLLKKVKLEDYSFLSSRS